MLTEYLNAALETAHYEKIEDEEPYYGEIPALQGVWATGSSLEKCRRSLAATLEDWLLFSLQRGEEVPAIGGVMLLRPRKAG